MPAHHVCLSDMHLGYEKCVLNDPVVQDHLVDQIALLCGGSTDRLILNGDCFEGCVPMCAGQHDLAGFNPNMAEISKSFLQKFTDKIHTTSLVILWGNHDYCLWQKVAASCGVPTFTLFGPQLPEWFAPLHPASEWLEGKACPYKPCSDYCRFPIPCCMANSSEEEVWTLVKAFVARTLHAR